MSWSITTEVSNKPLVGSAIRRLVYNGIQIRAHTTGVDAWSLSRRVRNHRSMHELPLSDRTELGHRHPVAGHDDRLTGLHLAEYRAGVVAQLPLGNGPAHGERE